MSPRPATLLSFTAAFAVLVSLALALAPSEAQALDGDDWCTARPAPCVLAATRDGAPVQATDPAWDVDVVPEDDGASFAVTRADGDADLGTAERDHVWSITLDLGAVEARSVVATVRDLVVTRSRAGERRIATVTGEPVRVTEAAECTTAEPWVCPDRATTERQARFGGTITDLRDVVDMKRREAMAGFDVSTSFARASSSPLFLETAAGGIGVGVRLANQRTYPDGTAFKGFARMRLPATMLSVVYGIDDLAALRTKGLRATTAPRDGTTSVARDPAGGAMLVTASGSSSSVRTLTASRGAVAPTRPTKVTTKRLSPHWARIGYRTAKSQGASITGYTVKCNAVRSKHRVVVRDRAPKTRVEKLRIHKAYRCKVRATSAVGSGPWSKVTKLAARPRLARR